MPKIKRSSQAIKVKSESSLFRDIIDTHEKINSYLDKDPSIDKYGEGKRLISGEPPIISALIAKKKESRVNKNETFNCFVIDRENECSSGNDELVEFINKLSQNIQTLPDPTRFQLNVFDSGHWYPIDLYIKNGQVSSFIFDAAGNYKFESALTLLKNKFPNGSHYSFQVEVSIKESSMKKKPNDIQDEDLNISTVQKSGYGCRVFSAYHAFNMSKSDPDELYTSLQASEAKKIRQIPDEVFINTNKINNAYKEVDAPAHTITLRSIQPNQNLVRLLRPTQSYTQLNELSDEVKNTKIARQSGDISLKEYTDSKAEKDSSNRRINATLLNKSQGYRAKVMEFKEQNLEQDINIIMSQRAGFAYLDNPSLFTLDDLLSKGDKDNVLNIAYDFFNNYYTQLPKNTDKSFLGISFDAKNLDLSYQTLEHLSNLIKKYENDEIDKGTFVTSFMANVCELQESLKNNHSVRTIKVLNNVIDNIIVSQKPDTPKFSI